MAVHSSCAPPFRLVLVAATLETKAVVLDAWIGNRYKPDPLVTDGGVGNVDAEHFQSFFELFQGEIVFVQHGGSPFSWLVVLAPKQIS